MNTSFKKLTIVLFLVIGFIQLNAEFPVKMKSFAKSAILPGWGELSQNHKSGYLFLSTEVALILSTKYFNEESKIKISQSKNYAYKKANMSNNLKSDEQLIMVGKYRSSGFESGGYNEYIVIQAKTLYPDEPANQANYIMENQLSDQYYWNWDSKASQNKYLIMRKRSLEIKDYAKAISGFIILNHAVSAFNAARVTKKNVELGFDLNIENKPLITCGVHF